MNDQLTARGTPMVHVCCGTRLRRIDIDAGSSSLTFTFCGRCEHMSWFSDGVPVSRDDATTLAGSMPSRRSGTAGR
jgi:hypothetical protein